MEVNIFFTLFLAFIIHSVSSFKTGLESGLVCIKCVGTHPGCTLYDMDWRWNWGVICPRADDVCVKIIERKGADVMVTRDCLSNLDAFRVDVPADKYEGCRRANKDVKIGQYTFNRIKELDTKRNYYDNTTFCFCKFDHWCNSGRSLESNTLFIVISTVIAFIFATFAK